MLARRLLGLGAAALFAAGCSPAPQGVSPDLMPSLPVHARHPDRSQSWVLPVAKSAKELLYISDDATDDVDVYDYPSGTQVGTLTGFDQPSGLCVDKIGDVWITNYGGGFVSEYARGESKPLQTLALGAYQAGCSIDPTTGDLAVTELYGLLAVFKDARGRPKSYTSTACPAFSSPGYDDKGNLFAESAVDDVALICEFPHGGSKLRTVSSNLTIYYPAGVMWDGKRLAFADQDFEDESISAIYQASESSSGALTLVGTTELPDSGCGKNDVVQPFILGTKNTPSNKRQGTLVIAGNYSCLGREDIWKYPAGGDPTGTFPGPSFPSGQAVSIKP